MKVSRNRESVKLGADATIFDTYCTTMHDLSPVENLMMAVYEQAIIDYKSLAVKGVDEVASKNSAYSVAEIEEFINNSPVNNYMRVDGKVLLNGIKEMYQKADMEEDNEREDDDLGLDA